MRNILRPSPNYSDVILIGAGIMSATLALLLKELEPDLNITVYERLNTVALESSSAWNNAGTGHSALCELNYTPQLPDGSIDIEKALKVFDAFQRSKQLWAHLVDQKAIEDPSEFIRTVPHISFVEGEEDVNFLRIRFEALKKLPAFSEIEFSEDPKRLHEWMPLMFEGRKTASNLPVAATRMAGTDVDFGKLTVLIFDYLKKKSGFKIRLSHEVEKIDRLEDGNWMITLDNLATSKRNKKKVFAPFVFIGAGGGALPLLDKSGIDEADGYGGFPVSGQWLRCTNSQVIEKHFAKVYGKAAVGAPPMSVPHLDTRVIKGRRELLFGPFAGFTTKFLKEGSFLDLPGSIGFDNVIPMLQVGFKNFELTKYLILQVTLSPEERLKELKVFYPEAIIEDWELLVAGQRVQIIKKDLGIGGKLEFGTEIVAAGDGSLAALLGASPGASTAVDIMLKLIQKCFPERFRSQEWKVKLEEIFYAFDQTLFDKNEILEKINTKTNQLLNLVIE